MQNLSAQDDRRQRQLRELRDWHHRVHLQFCRQVYMQQISQGGHATLEQPAGAKSKPKHFMIFLVTTPPSTSVSMDVCAWPTLANGCR